MGEGQLTLSLSLCCVSPACGQAPLSPSVLQGNSAQEGSWPWQASLHWIGQYLCGGSLINSNWVLTAAVCFNKSSTNASQWTVYLGRQTQLGLNPHEVTRGVQTIILYPYTSYIFYDNIALLKLSSPVNFTDYIQPICLADVNSSFHNCTSCWITGWGNMTDNTALSGNKTLQQVQLPIIENTDCVDQIYKIYNFPYVTEKMICAGVIQNNLSSCRDLYYPITGILGSPLVCKQESSWIQAGVVDFRNFCPTYLLVQAGVPNYKSWIIERVGSNSTNFVQYSVNSTFSTVSSTTAPVSTAPSTTAPVSTASSATTRPVTTASFTPNIATSTTSDALPRLHVGNVSSPPGDSAVSLCFLVQVCGRPKLNTPLLADQPAAEGSWPWMASLQRNGSHVCGGTLVTGDWVMTTAQCLPSPVIVQEWTVILGRLKQNGSNPFERSLGVQSVQTSQLGGTNIALLKLDTKVSFTDYIQPICLAGERVSFPTGAQCWVTGWGNATGTGENTLQQVSTVITACVNVSSADNLCTGSLDLQQGDSGDPLVCKQDSLWIQASIVAVDNTVQRNGRVARALQQGVFPKVSRYQSFLQSNVGPTLPLINPNTVVTTTPTPSSASSLGHTVLQLAVLSLLLTT
ncbi:TMPS9 protease, partial [Atractosteus spatula]|nr:TMPS9 protease [Atractosteus spatula]